MTAITKPREVSVPGFPATSLADEAGPWRRAWPDAVEVGADPQALWDRIAHNGLCVPSAWLGSGGWPTLWRRATQPPEARAPY